MRWSFFLREALRGLRRSSAPALAALLTVLLTAVVLGVFIPIVQATTGTANEVRSRVVVDVYVKDSATQLEQVGRVRITSGNQVLAAGNIANDLVVMDDFIYGEPRLAAVGTPDAGSTGILLVLSFGLLLGAGWLRRARQGDAG